MDVKYGDVVFITLDKGIGSEQCGNRPAVVIQNNKGNENSPTTIVVLLTSKWKNKAKLPTHVLLKNLDSNYNSKYEYSLVIAEHIRTIDTRRITRVIGHVPDEDMKKIKHALKISLNLL